MTSFSAEETLLAVLDAQLLPAAVRELDDAVFALTKTQVLRAGGEVYTGPCLWAQLRQAINEGQRGSGAQKLGGSFRSSPAVWLAGLDLATEIERAVVEWSGKRGHTLELLADLPRLPWRPQDATEVSRRARIVRKWTAKIEKMLSGDWFEISPGGCSQCGADTVAVTDGLGEVVRKPAVIVTPLGMNCAACESHWTATQILEMALTLPEDEAA
ncbi:DUF7341 domain-containing protein [Rhodococcus aetherivorans]|uniref:DUF7341 domain-containing protein n=1 Tax=Rhodococcus aetherivorans TaxID=191292 RepID=UPI001E35F811|nr:hypothetical protein [Rhodococcus aetherivorans]UGQ39388.1 hypothetical protein LRQ66_14320 [Rhodococcus aetherivorans]